MTGKVENNQSMLPPEPQGFVMILSGASGAGKGTLIDELKEIRDDFLLSISTTTRPPREEGVKGEHYQHVSREEFQQLVSDGSFLEWAEVHGNMYGTRRGWVEEKLGEGWIVILEIDVQGALQVMERKIDYTSVFVTPPERETAFERLKARGTESEEDIQRRIRNAKWEYQQMNRFEYMVVNESGKAKEAAKVLSAILTAERARMGRSGIRP